MKKIATAIIIASAIELAKSDRTKDMTMQVDLDAVIAAVQNNCAFDCKRQIIAAIRALPASNARIDAGDAMKAACINAVTCGGVGVREFEQIIADAIEALDTAAIVGDAA